jgi:hypothetical protein
MRAESIRTDQCRQPRPLARISRQQRSRNEQRASFLHMDLVTMFRRIELFDEISEEHYRRFIEATQRSIDDPDYRIEKDNPRFWKSGLAGFGNPVIWDAWGQMNSPRYPVNKNTRFYFTEEGWRRYGRKTIEVCQQVGQRYRVIRIKENSVDVIYRDEVQVAVRPKKKPRDKGSRSAR